MNVECRRDVFCLFKKRLSAAKPSFDILRFDIRYSAVRCSARPPAARAASLIIKKPCHFGVVSYERFRVQVQSEQERYQILRWFDLG